MVRCSRPLTTYPARLLSGRPGVLSAPQPRPGRPLRRGRAPHRSRFRTDLTMADVIAEARGAGQLALIPLADIA